MKAKKNRTVGRPALSVDDRKKRVTVSLKPTSDKAWSEFAEACKVAKGSLAEWLVLAPEAADARKLALKEARYFIPRDEPKKK